MKKPGRFEEFMRSYGEWVIRQRWSIVVVGTLLAIGIAVGAGNLWFDTDYRAFFSKENPQLQSFEAMQNIYTKNDNILIVLAPEDGDVFTARNLAAIEKLTEKAWKVPYAIRVDAISNFQHTIAEGDDLLVADLVEDAASLSPAEIEARRAVALQEPALFKRLINVDSDVSGINVTLQLPGESMMEVPDAAAYARDLASSFEQEYPGIKTYLTGTVMLNNAFSEAGQSDMMTLVPLMYLLIFVVMAFLLRSVSGTIATFSVITFATIIAMGFAGWFGVGLTPPSANATTMIMTIAIADCVHILLSMLREMRVGKSKREAIIESLRVNMSPVFLTSLTTAIGFLSMNFSDAPPFHHLGNITAAGVLAAWLYSVLFLPALMAILPVRVKYREERRSGFIDKLAEFVIGRRKALLWGSAFVVGGLTAMISLNEMNDQFVDYFDKSIQFRTDSDFAADHLTGIYQVEFSLESGESGGISNPEYLQTVEEFTEWYRTQPNVVHVSSFTEVMKRVNKSMHGDLPAYYRIPDDRELAAQFLLLYELSLPYGLDLNNQINIDKSATRFTVTLDDVSSREIREAASIGEEWLRKNAPQTMHATAASSAVMFAYISERNIEGMLVGTTAALILISFCLFIALRSGKYGLISLIPNLVPAALAFGVWGLLVGQVNLGLAIVTGMTLGIVVDDTVHFLSKYIRARREQGLNAEDAVRYAFSTVGMALIVTSVVLSIGFGILAFSAFDLNGSMGKLTAITIMIALVADFLLLPPLLITIDGRKNNSADDADIESLLQPSSQSTGA